MTKSGKRYLTPRELDEWYDAIGAVLRQPRPTMFRLPAAMEMTVSKPIRLQLREVGGVLCRMPLQSH